MFGEKTAELMFSPSSSGKMLPPPIIDVLGFLFSRCAAFAMCRHDRGDPVSIPAPEMDCGKLKTVNTVNTAFTILLP